MQVGELIDVLMECPSGMRIIIARDSIGSSYADVASLDAYISKSDPEGKSTLIFVPKASEVVIEGLLSAGVTND